MPSATVTTHFDHPCDRVWSALSDFARAPERISGITEVEMLTSGPVGKGTRFRESRVVMKKKATETMEVTAWNPPHSYTLECSPCGCHYRFSVSCRDQGQRTEVELSFDATPLTFMAKVMSFLMGRMMKGMCLKAFTKDMDDVKKWLDGQGAVAGAAAQPA